VRTFIAIEVNDQDVLNSIHKIQTELNIKAKPVELHNMHFTVQFLGEVSEEMIRKISDALRWYRIFCIFDKFCKHWSFS